MRLRPSEPLGHSSPNPAPPREFGVTFGAKRVWQGGAAPGLPRVDQRTSLAVSNRTSSDLPLVTRRSQRCRCGLGLRASYDSTQLTLHQGLSGEAPQELMSADQTSGRL